MFDLQRQLIRLAPTLQTAPQVIGCAVELFEIPAIYAPKGAPVSTPARRTKVFGTAALKSELKRIQEGIIIEMTNWLGGHKAAERLAKSLVRVDGPARELIVEIPTDTLLWRSTDLTARILETYMAVFTHIEVLWESTLEPPVLHAIRQTLPSGELIPAPDGDYSLRWRGERSVGKAFGQAWIQPQRERSATVRIECVNESGDPLPVALLLPELNEILDRLRVIGT